MASADSWTSPSMVIAYFTIAILVAGFWITHRQLVLLMQHHDDNHTWNRKHAAEEACSRFETKETRLLTKHLDYINRDHKQRPISKSDIDAVLAKFKKDNPNDSEGLEKLEYDLRVEINNLLNYHEGLARGIRLGIYDETVIHEAFRGMILKSSYMFRPYTSERQKVSDNDRIWEDMTLLVERWEKVTDKRKFVPELLGKQPQ